jgi:hypothetical protein
MKKTLIILTVTTWSVALGITGCRAGNKHSQIEEKNQMGISLQSDTVHPIIKKLLYNLPLEKSRLDLREVMINDKRFVLTDTTFNDFPPPNFFKGIATDQGIIQSKTDSVQIMLIYGNAILTTVKGGEPDSSKHPMIIESTYYFSSKKDAQTEYERILNLIKPLYNDTTSTMDDKWESTYNKGAQKGTQKCLGKIFDHFEPYYRVSVSQIDFIPDNNSKPTYVLNISFSKEDK